MLLWPNTINGIRYFLIDNLGFSTNDIGIIYTLSSFLYIVYFFFMNTFFKGYKFKNFYILICIIMLINIVIRIMMMIPIFYSIAFLLSICDQSINNLFYDLPTIPLLSVVCKNCPKS